MGLSEQFVRMKFKEKNQVAQVGNIGVFHSEYSIEKVGRKKSNLSIIKRSQLPMGIDDELITIKEASNLTGISKRKLRALCRYGLVASVKRGRKYLLSYESLLNYIEKEDY